MALFGSKKKTSATPSAPKGAPRKGAGKKAIPSGIEYALKNPRITEKAAYASEKGVYVFDISAGATKIDVAQAIERIYNVVPRKVNIAKIPAKKVFTRGSRGVKKGGKKAYVYLKKGDSIEII